MKNHQRCQVLTRVGLAASKLECHPIRAKKGRLFICTNNKRKEDYFNPRFGKFRVLVLDPMHMKCGLMSDRRTWATNLENGGLTLYV
jgi:hypothetical protein